MELNGQALTLSDIAGVALNGEEVKISDLARPRILASRKVVEEIIARDAVVYGVTTGFGKLSDVRIPRDALSDLQLNLVRSHACGIGQPLSEPEVRVMMLLRANVLALGFSGIRLEIIQMLCEMLNHRVHPVVPEKGSVGASGDLAPLALAFDYAAIAIVDLMSMSERRTDRLVNPDKSEGLPAFLARQPGLESGFMTAHVAAASLVNEARVLAHPASVDNITTSGGKEDHVSMGMTSALKLRSIVDLAENLLAIELLAAAEGLEHRRPLKSGAGVERAFAIVRKLAQPLTQDRSLANDIARVAEAIRRGDFDGGNDKL
jgi:histidine ammonia-lyase